MKKTKLDIDYEFDFELIGVISSFKDYKLAWNINKTLGIELSKDEDLVIKFINYTLVISNYSFQIDHSIIRMIKNLTLESGNKNHQYLIPELKHIDFFLQIVSEDDTYNLNDTLQKIRETAGVELAMYIEIEELKSKENLIYE